MYNAELPNNRGNRIYRVTNELNDKPPTERQTGPGSEEAIRQKHGNNETLSGFRR